MARQGNRRQNQSHSGTKEMKHRRKHRPVADIIQKDVERFARHEGCFYFAPDIDPYRLGSALSSYAMTVDPSTVIALLDGSVNGAAETGSIITEEAIYSRTNNNPLQILHYADVTTLLYQTGKKKNDEGGIVKQWSLEIKTTDGGQLLYD